MRFLGADDAAPDCEAEPQGDGGGAGEPAGSTEGDGIKIVYFAQLRGKLFYEWPE